MTSNGTGTSESVPFAVASKVNSTWLRNESGRFVRALRRRCTKRRGRGRWTAMSRRLLIRVGQPDQRWFRKSPSQQLDANWKATRREAGWHGDRREAGLSRKSGVGADLIPSDPRCDSASGGIGDGVKAVLVHRLDDGLDPERHAPPVCCDSPHCSSSRPAPRWHLRGIPAAARNAGQTQGAPRPT